MERINMKTLKNIKKTLMEIAQTLAQNDNIVKLLYNDEPTALTDPKPDVTLNKLIEEHYICVCAPTESGIKNQWKNTFLTVLLDSCYFGTQDDNTSVTYKIYVSTDEQHIQLNDNKHRLLELADEVISTLDGFKLSTAGKIEVKNFVHTMLSEFRFAYAIIIGFNDQNPRKVEI